MSRKTEVISDKEAKKAGTSMIKEELQRKKNNTDYTIQVKREPKAIDTFPLLPTGSQIFLEWNVKEEEDKPKVNILGVDQKEMAKTKKMANPYWTVIAVGEDVTGVNLGDKLLMKPGVDVEIVMNDSIPELGELKYHVTYKHSVEAIIRKEFLK